METKDDVKNTLIEIRNIFNSNEHEVKSIIKCFFDFALNNGFIDLKDRDVLCMYLTHPKNDIINRSHYTVGYEKTLLRRAIVRLKRIKPILEDYCELKADNTYLEEKIKFLEYTIKINNYSTEEPIKMNRENLKLLCTKIDFGCGLSNRAVNCLHSYYDNVRSFGDLLKLNDKSFINMRNLGKRTAVELRTFIEELREKVKSNQNKL